MSVEVRKSQHKYIIGPRGSGIQEILLATGVSVEVPNQDSVETITLRGEQDKLGPALTMVYSKVRHCRICVSFGKFKHITDFLISWRNK